MTTTMTIEQYAKHILEENDCDIYTYGGENSKHIMHDLKEAYCVGDLAYPYIDVANAILAMSRPKPIVRDPYRVLWSNEDSCDAHGSNSVEEARDSALEILTNWIVEAQAEWNSDTPTEDERDSFNYMIEEFYVEVQKYNPATDEYEEVWHPDYDDLAQIGWKEID